MSDQTANPELLAPAGSPRQSVLSNPELLAPAGSPRQSVLSNPELLAPAGSPRQSVLSNPELLAPAGSLEKLKYALAYGADAVYFGLPAFSLRAKTDFNAKDMAAAVKYAHQLKKKVYVTINIFAHNRHIKDLPRHLKQLEKINPDAVIISDPGVLLLVKRNAPGIPIHLSTQMNTLNGEAVKFWQKQGVRRIILGREATLADIREIHRAAPKMELEVFVHGAMCVSYSGRCYLSAWLNNRSANLGECTQPCRWEYKVYLEERLRPGQMIPVEADDKGTYIMNSKDLCLIDYLKDLKNAGVSSFKIEGRTKSIYYLAVVVKAYRRAIDSGFSSLEIKKMKSELGKIDNRGYTIGFLLGSKDEEKSRQEFGTAKANCVWDFVGQTVKPKREKRKMQNEKSKAQNEKCKMQNKKSEIQTIRIRVHNTLKAGDDIGLVTPENCYKMKVAELRNKKGNAVKEAHGGTDEIFMLAVPAGWKFGERDVIRKMVGNQ